MLVVAGFAAWLLILALVYLIRPRAMIHTVPLLAASGKHRWMVWVTFAAAVMICVLPMGLSPIWNGEIPEHRDQYERMAESILDGHLYLDYEVDPLLMEMDNPYDQGQREELGVSFHWDSAFYNGQYYMYFGIVPVFLIFLPFRVITGHALTTYHATQVFVAFFIAGIFALFRKFSKCFFRSMSLGIYLMLSVAFSLMSVWYAVSAPAMYCTAITSAMCLCVWSLYFFVSAVWDTEEENRSIRLAFLGSLFGALAFGCRPPVALANILVIPMLATYIRERRMSFRLFMKLFAAAVPYLVVAALLMLYNYTRFADPFEFGQSYQLTVADQRSYGGIGSVQYWPALLEGLLAFFVLSSFTVSPLSLGVLLSFPVTFYSVICAENENVKKRIKNSKVSAFIIILFLIPVIIAVIDTLWSPFFLPRYRMDVYWLIGILTFLMIGFYYETRQEKTRFSFTVSVWALLAVAMSVLMFWWPNDSNYSAYYGYAGMMPVKILTLGLVS